MFSSQKVFIFMVRIVFKLNLILITLSVMLHFIFYLYESIPLSTSLRSWVHFTFHLCGNVSSSRNKRSSTTFFCFFVANSMWINFGSNCLEYCEVILLYGNLPRFPSSWERSLSTKQFPSYHKKSAYPIRCEWLLKLSNYRRILGFVCMWEGIFHDGGVSNTNNFIFHASKSICTKFDWNFI